MIDVAPKISVIIPTKDRITLLPRAVASVLAAERIDIETCIVDDHSTPPAKTSLGAFRDDPRLRILVQDPGRTGVSAARSLGLNNARGALLFFLDDDDKIAPGYIEKVETLDHNAFAYGCAAHERDDGSGTNIVDRRSGESPIPSNAPLRKQMFGLGMGFWMTRARSETIGVLDEDPLINEGTDYFCRLLHSGMIGEAWSYIRSDSSLFMQAKFAARFVAKSAAYLLKPSKRRCQRNPA